LSKADCKSFRDNSRKFLTAELISESKSVDENAEFITNSITRAAGLSIPQNKNRKRKHPKPLPYWNENCKKAIYDRNKAKNAMHKNKTLDNCITYRRLKGKVQHVIESSAREYWQNYCNTLDKSTKLGTVWRMAQKMNGVHRENKISNLTVNGSLIETNKEKTDIFKKVFRTLAVIKTITAHSCYVKNHRIKS